MAKKKELEPLSGDALLSQISETVQAQGNKNRERHNATMKVLCMIASSFGYTINEDDGTIVSAEKKAQQASFSHQDKVELARYISTQIPKPAPPAVIKASVDSSVHIQNNEYLMQQLLQGWKNREDEVRKKQKEDTEAIAMNQVDKSVKEYLHERDRKEAAQRKENAFLRKVKRVVSKLYNGYVSDKFKHTIAYAFGILGIISAIVMYVSMYAYKASLDAEVREYLTIRPFLVNDRDYITTIENLRELICREDREHLLNAYDSVTFENYMKREWEKRRHFEAEMERYNRCR